MKIDTFGYFFQYAMKSLKRNATTTIASIINIAVTVFIFRLFLLYMMLVKRIMNKELIWLGVPIFILLIGILLFLIVITIKMVVFCRRREIDIMKFVGATDWFIRWIFIIEGLIIGIIGACVGNLVLLFLYRLLYTKAMIFTEVFNLIQSTFVTDTMFYQFGIVGAFIGSVGYIIGLRKILKCGA